MYIRRAPRVWPLFGLLLFCPLLFRPAGAAEIYKCEDASGNVKYSDEVCGAQAEKIDIELAPPAYPRETPPGRQDAVNKNVLDDKQALIVAARVGKNADIRALLDKGVDIDSRSGYQLDTALLSAIDYGHFDSLDLLARRGADLTLTGKDDKSALHYAVAKGNRRMARYLLNRELDPNQQDTFGNSPLHEASRRGDREMVALLLEYKADVEITNEQGYTPLLTAVRYQKPRIVKHLVAAHADTGVRSASGQSLLMLTVKHGRSDTLKTMLQYDRFIDARDNNGTTPLHAAAGYGRNNMVKVLLDAGADVNARDNDGQSVLERAEGRRRLDMLKLLRKAGARQGSE